MTDFRREDISNQKAYDLLRDWIKLVARHTNPDQDISELLGWLWKLKPQTPDPLTGLVRCGCGGKAKCLHYLTPDGDYAVKCGKCKIMTDWFNSPEDAIKAFNTAMVYRGGAE